MSALLCCVGVALTVLALLRDLPSIVAWWLQEKEGY